VTADSRTYAIAARIQHTLYDIGVSRSDVERHCGECISYRFNAAMVPGRWVAYARELLRGESVLVATAVDFPLGLMTALGRQHEAVQLVTDGADQIDLGVPIGLLKDGEYGEFRSSIAEIVEAVAPVPVKVMLELPLLTPAERDHAVELAVGAGAAYLKNASSGRVGAATPADIRFLRDAAPPEVGIKASGSITRRAQALALFEAGADLLGTSDGIAIVTGRDAVAATY
jgi:deoxyribose-phosphate aldolase